MYTTHQLQISKKNSVIMPLKESTLLFSLCKGQPAPCKAVSVLCCIMYKSSWIIHRIGERHVHSHTKRVCLYVCYQLSRRVAGCLRFWTKLSGFSGSGFSPLFLALAAICQHVGSQVQLPLVWVKIHPLHTACRVLL